MEKDLYNSEYYLKHCKSWSGVEYPLFKRDTKCPAARYVGGTSVNLCVCDRPSECPGVQEAIELVESWSDQQKET